LDGKQIFRRDCSETSSLKTKGGNAIEVQMESLMPDLSKITKAKRIKKVVLIHVWLSGIKARYKLIFFGQGLLLK
jgi:hypothetical protein